MKRDIERSAARRSCGKVWHLNAVAGMAFILTCGLANADTIKAPASIVQANKIIYCAAVGAPPLSFYKENNDLVGMEVDFGNELARRMGVKAEWTNVQFDGIIPALAAKHCDAIISGLYDKPKRREVIDFIDYMNSAQTIVVARGNPKGIKTLADLSGLKLSASDGTTIQSLAEQENEKLVAAGKLPITIVTFPTETDAIQALRINQVQAYGTTIEISAYYVFLAPKLFELAGEPFNTIKAGIGLRKDDGELKQALIQAFAAMKEDGTYLKIMAAWGLDKLELQ
jgi:polar amino acid transport system substrate-binding protein